MNKEMTVNGKTGTNEQFFRSVMTIWGKDLQKRNSEGILLPLCCLTGYKLHIIVVTEWRSYRRREHYAGIIKSRSW
jgi:hypothetical protein